MRYFFTLIVLCVSLVSYPQEVYNKPLIDSLTSITNTNTPSRHFAKLYLETILITNEHLVTQTDSIRQFVIGFETQFANYFFQAHQNYILNLPQDEIWKKYYSDTSLNELQFLFLGMNAHINGDMGNALKDIYDLSTLKKYTPNLLRFQRSIEDLYERIYLTGKPFKKVKKLHILTLGFDKLIGRKLILKWRKRQVKLAISYYSNEKKYNKLRRKINRKMYKSNQFALKWIR